MLIKNLLAGAKRAPVQTLEAGKPVSAAIEIFGKERFRCLPITQGESLVGIVTIRDVMRFLAVRGAAGLSAPIEEAMTREPAIVSLTDTVDAAEKAFDGRFNHLPVVDGGKLVGLLTPKDLLEVRLGDVRTLATDLERYILGG